ncbi:DEAD/DEAH box helicase [Aggregicoccus sp. 17bor-14]|uniref:DEAD/DEAH box helicase n=1 Tax=Myxococcaceae TaxID=31 RepID=UPI0012F40812|nr:DEAD/DEAH box helicase [Simulacricoccus sp. 17bor-14]MRI88324.1 DEAD/DEAH box helicase [Aggregicoccus sp. 17bor-14]
MSATFESLGLSPESLATLRRARFEAPTPIQSQAIPPALAGRDVVGCAATGTGKTAAFLLPLMERFRGQEGTRGLVLAPTRELVMQIAEQARFFGEAHGLRHAVVIGGEDMNAQVEALKQQPTFILATPGRLVDLLSTKSVNLSRVEGLVLDEADRMLDMGFQQQLEEILKVLPKQHQTLLFSATLGHDVTEFAQRQLRKPVRVEVTPSGTPAARAAQKLYVVKQDEKYAMLLTLLKRDEASVLVFAATKQRADKVLKALKREGYKAAAIHSDRTQNQRKQALEGFSRGQYRCLVATDIAARGLDVEEIGHVINFDLPHSPEDYVHRIGRTARAGASGLASTFATEDDAERLKEIERIIRARIPRAEVPRRDATFVAELERFYAAQKDPGPPQPDHGVSGKRPGEPLGRHARSHGKPQAQAPAKPERRVRTSDEDEGRAPRRAPLPPGRMDARQQRDARGASPRRLEAAEGRSEGRRQGVRGEGRGALGKARGGGKPGKSFAAGGGSKGFGARGAGGGPRRSGPASGGPRKGPGGGGRGGGRAPGGRR